MHLRRNISDDKKGSIEGLPLEMLIIILVMGISIPIIWNSAKYYSKNDLEKEIITELEIFSEKVEDVASSDKGSTRTIKIDIEDNILSKINNVKIGGDTLEKMSNVRYEIDGEKKRYSLDNLFVSNITDEKTFSMKIPLNGEKVFIKNSGFIANRIDVIEVGIAGRVNA